MYLCVIYLVLLFVIKCCVFFLYVCRSFFLILYVCMSFVIDFFMYLFPSSMVYIFPYFVIAVPFCVVFVSSLLFHCVSLFL